MADIKSLLAYKILRTTAGWALEPFSDLIRRLRAVTEDHFREKKLGIDTAGSASVKNDVTLFKDSSSYVPTPYKDMEKMFAGLDLGPDDVFVDLGCGKGRVIFSVAAKRLKKVIGVEARRDMFEIASRNLKGLKIKNTPVEIVHADAASFDMREGTVFFMFQPFGKRTRSKVMGNIKDSLGHNPRKVRIVCYGGPDSDALEDCDWLARESRIADAGIDIWCSRLSVGEPRP